MENMRQSIGLQAIGQRDPLVQYRTMSFQMFTEMNEEIRNEVARTIFHLAPNLPQPASQLSNASSTPLKADALAAAQRIALAQAGQQSIMSAANAPQQGISGRTVASVNAPTHAADGRRLSRRERRAIERKNKKAQRSKAGPLTPWQSRFKSETRDEEAVATDHRALLDDLLEVMSERPADWHSDFIRTVAAWPIENETVYGETFHYFIGSEAFNWKRLAERIATQLADEGCSE